MIYKVDIAFQNVTGGFGEFGFSITFDVDLKDLSEDDILELQGSVVEQLEEKYGTIDQGGGELTLDFDCVDVESASVAIKLSEKIYRMLSKNV